MIGAKSSISFDDLGNLPYMGQVIKEGLRLGGPVPITFREPQRDIPVNSGGVIPYKSLVMVSSGPSEFVKKKLM